MGQPQLAQALQKMMGAQGAVGVRGGHGELFPEKGWASKPSMNLPTAMMLPIVGARHRAIPKHTKDLFIGCLRTFRNQAF
jgi:hypothetical protein